MSTFDLLALAIIALLVVLAGIMAAAEVAITRMSRVRAYHLRERGRRGAAALVRIVESPAPHLNVVLLLTLLLHLGGTTVATALAVRLVGGYGEALATLAMTLFLFVLAEVVPKTFTVLHTDRVALALAPLIVALRRAFGPVARVLIVIANAILPGKGLHEGPFVTESEIRAMADAASSEASIEESEKELIHSIFDFGDTVVREVMVPRPDMVAIEASLPVRAGLAFVIEHGYSRVPVYRDHIDEVTGILHAKDLLLRSHVGDTDRPLGEIVRPVNFVPDTKRVSDLLRDMQRGRYHMAIVVNEYGSVIGLVTLEDLVEELVGEIADEYDRDEPDLQPVDAQRFYVNGRMSVSDLGAILDVELPSTGWYTAGGLITGLLGRLPAEGEAVEFEGIRFVASRVVRHRVVKVLVERIMPPGTTPPVTGTRGGSRASCQSRRISDARS